jgi:hypothetical protein
MSQYDVAIGMDSSTLDKGMKQLYANQQAREKLFQGVHEDTLMSAKYTASWTVQSSPTFVLSPPSAQTWTGSIDLEGKHPTSVLPTQNIFQLKFPLSAQYKLANKASISGTADVIVIAQATIQGSVLTLVPLSLWLDESRMRAWDKLILNMIINKVLQKTQATLSGINIPPLSFALPETNATIHLTPPQVTLTDSLLVLVASQASRGHVDLDGAVFPANQPLFVLLSPSLIEEMAQDLAKTKLEGQTYSVGPEKYGKFLSYSASATLNHVNNIIAHSENMTKLSADIAFSFSAELRPFNIGGPCAVTAATHQL